MLFSTSICWFSVFLTYVSHTTSSFRSKRFLWITPDRRLIFPPGTVLDLKPTIQIPFLKKDEPPDGIHSDIQISWFFYIIFNELGLTHDSHPWPPFYPFGSLFGPLKKRSILSLPSPSLFPGGERTFIYPKLETLFSSIGWQGRPCMLRLVCETHEYPLKYGYGLLGEIFTLFFTVSKSAYAESHMPNYLRAEEMGRTGNCTEYMQHCEKSLFIWERKPNPNVNKREEASKTDSEKDGRRNVFM